ncbi:hypothetical protein BVG81_000640 [Haliangium sp. UPWRP_2]|nr:hypothetical protein BVG81_000640 [Haliangium sp. UPWRP_2]
MLTLRQGNSKTDIRIDADEARVNHEAVEAIANHPQLYQRSGELVSVLKRRRHGRLSPIISPLPPAVLRSWLTDVAQFRDHHGHAHPPEWCLHYVRSVGEWGVPELDYAVEHPVIRPDGTVLQAEGYDPVTRVMYSPSTKFEFVPDRPSQNEVIEARERLLDLVVDFPFAQPVHRNAWLAGLLTFFARPAYDGATPFFLVDGNVRGAGKSFLCHVASLLATGRRMDPTTQAADEAEEGKLITAVCRAGDVCKLIDNITRPFGSGKFDAALTTTTWEDRLLGQSQLLSLVHRCIWFGTGNNVQFNARADTARRTLHIRLLSQEQNPEKRTGFKYPDLAGHILRHRGRYVADCLTLLRAYQVAKPTLNLKLKPWGSFEEWSEIVRGTIVFAGLDDPIEAHDHLTRIADNSASSLANLISGWRELCTAHDVEGCTVRQALEWLAEDVEYKRTSPGHTIRFNTLRDALVELCNTAGRPLPDAKQLGYALRGFRGRVVGDEYLECSDREEGGRAWSVLKLKTKAKSEPESIAAQVG